MRPIIAQPTCHPARSPSESRHCLDARPAFVSGPYFAPRGKNEPRPSGRISGGELGCTARCTPAKQFLLEKVAKQNPAPRRLPVIRPTHFVLHTSSGNDIWVGIRERGKISCR